MDLLAQQKKKSVGVGNPEQAPVQEPVQANLGANRFFIPEGGCSFRDVVQGSKRIEIGSLPSESVACQSKLVVEAPADSGALKDLFGKALIDRTKDLPTLIKLDKLLAEAGWVDMEIMYVSGLTLMLKFQEVEEASNFVLDSNLWRGWFSALDVWEGQNEVFDCVVAKFGKLVHPANLNLDNGELSVVCVGILVGEGSRINVPVKLKWRDRSFMLWVSEEAGDWEPDCVGLVMRQGVSEGHGTEAGCLPAMADTSPVGTTEAEEVREQGGEESAPAVNRDTCMGGTEVVNDLSIPKVVHGGNLF
ncbi:hypothetical protein HanXRQr2_Chr06g0264631 [Helianthus annuus]|uniref:DUF4283 domain-containing protein n=1 Tax=Helianthus annuus TaxID=4232 RepID=A0A9K3ITJ8_HELAN|nr:hypothetical protein HanXRQr2_Chr06g0264631 [Helianthus annuus]KAJ0560943.1 hypothetical protein HanHA300_Chr06g0217151 [Helianthus annuus]KAJ0567432.1 hypothetical protein HanIR_Chr06g0284711 [Helianthus annuus]KAJ0573978.1 hypothetical protein HanHA89_Chr06g0232901 [Helianthus annuus]KAJ0738310.1 hypothetical protein HanLR1_Chr06g0216811 [Helianthus annuus]